MEANGAERPRAIVVAAGSWSAAVAVLGAVWALGGPGFPFGAADPRGAAVGSFFVSARPTSTGAAVAVFGVLGVGVAAGVLRGWRSRMLPALAIVMSAVLLVVVPDLRVIQNFLYLFFGYLQLWDLPLLMMLFAILGGVLWAGAALATRRSGAPRIAAARPEDGGPRWGRAATFAAAALALPYGVVRICWGIGIPLGVPPAYVHDERLGGLALVGLGAVPVLGAVLTLGLVQRWGEVVPRWIPVLGGRPVPVWLAVVPAAWASVLLVQAGVRILVWTLQSDGSITAENWGTGVPGLFWLPWGLALAAATYAYHQRRRARRPNRSSTVNVPEVSV